jgi:hypothetical protein
VRRFTIKEALRLVRKYGNTSDAAEILGVSRQSVCRRLNAEVAGWKSERAQRCSYRHGPEVQARAMELYARGVLVADIEAETGMCQKRIHTMAKEYGIQRRPRCSHLFDPDRLRSLYADLKSYRKVAEVMGCSYDTARRAVMGRDDR